MHDGPRARRCLLALDTSALLLAAALLALAAAGVARHAVWIVAVTVLAYLGSRVALELTRRRH